jgi:hypothetical protein
MPAVFRLFAMGIPKAKTKESAGKKPAKDKNDIKAYCEGHQ